MKENFSSQLETELDDAELAAEKEVSDLSAKAFDVLEEFEKQKTSPELFNKWENSFAKDPESFFSEENLANLQQMQAGERLAIFAHVSEDILVTPNLAKKYFSAFPLDAEAIKTLFDIRRGHPATSKEFYLFSLAAQEIDQTGPNQFFDMAKRRNLAPNFLLENGKHYLPEDFQKFGEKLAQNYFDVLKEASDLNIHGDHFLEADQIFGEEFSVLAEEQKAEFLRMALVNIHHSMVAEETLNSFFNEEDGKRPETTRASFDPAHSMLFQTHQASVVYDRAQGFFQHMMDSTADSGGDLEEYADHRIVLEILHQIKNVKADKEDNIALLVDFWNKSRNPIFANAVVEALNLQDVNLSASSLLDLLKKETGDRTHISALLYRLEFGQIGISESGVKYLEKMYDLEDLNRPDYFAQRLTASGEIGIFDENRVLQKYFELGDLASSDKTVKPKVHDFVYETLFRPRANETEQERLEREQYLKEFKENYFQFYDDKFFAQTAVRFNNLEFEEQGWFLMYYRKVDEETKAKLIDFAKKHGEAGLKSFLSLEYNDQNGEAILFLEGKLESQDFKKLFAKYLQIQNKAQVLAESISDSQFKDSFYDAIMSRASDILSTACKLAENGSAEAEFYQGQKLRVEKIEEVLESLEIFADFLEKLKALFLQEGAYDFSHLETSNLEGLDIYQFEVLDKATKKKSFANLSLRPQGTNEHLVEKEFDGEARINFLFSDQPIALDIKEKSRLEALSFRLDRECLNFDDEGKVVDRDNTRAQGRAALDFGSAFTDSGEQNNVLARVISVGNFYNAQAKSKKPEYYHNKESFYQTLGEAEIFAEVVEQIKDFIERKYVNKG
jgi:hypothetical protein